MNCINKTVKLCSLIITIFFLGGLGSSSSQAVQNKAADAYGDDAYADLVVGVPGENIAVLSTQFDNAGIINVIYGSPAGLGSPGNQTWDQRMEDSEDGVESGDQFGSALASGDFNGDGRYDVAVGVPMEDVRTETGTENSAGAVHIIYGSPSGGLSAVGNQFWHQDSPGIDGAAEYNDQFGRALAVGNFNGDDYDDLAIGIPYEDFEFAETIENAGSVIVLYGSLGGLSPTGVHPDQMWHQNSPGIIDSVEEYDWFGLALASGDFDDDSFDDLAIGAPGEDSPTKPDIGVVHVIYGSEGGLSATGNQQWEQYDWGGSAESESYDHFGSSLAAGKFKWRTHDALAIGVPGEDIVSTIPPRTVPDAGAVNIIYGFDDGLKDDLVDFIYQDGGYIEEAFEDLDQFGYSLAAVDFEGFGDDRLVVGVPFENLGDPMVSNAGAVHVLTMSSGHYHGSSMRFFHQGRSNIPGELELEAKFGFSLAPGDFNGDGKEDLGIGIPYGRCSAPQDGSVVVIFDSVWGSTADFEPQHWCQGNGLLDQAEEDDFFGVSLTSLPPSQNPLTRIYLPISIQDD